jgi:uncharacterized protein
MEPRLRPFWIDLLESCWQKKSVVWLAGVRRSGKTMLCQSLSDSEYFDCDLPRIRNLMVDPEQFFKHVSARRIVIDEIQRLGNPSEVLKIAADHFPDHRVLATGSSTMDASHKFADTLTGRKATVHLTPMLEGESEVFGPKPLRQRLISGGLPSFYLSEQYSESAFDDWIESYWARDIQELFRLNRRSSFLKFAELVFAQSGSIFEATRFAAPCEISRHTVSNYLSVLETTLLTTVVRPFTSRLAAEIVSAPKVFAFDTGFVAYFRGWRELRTEDLGLLWEHLVLNEIVGRLQTRKIFYWRDKRGHEIDFVFARRGAPPTAIECKWSAAQFEIRNFKAFRQNYEPGKSLVVCQDVERSFARDYDGIEVTFLSLAELISTLRLI